MEIKNDMAKSSKRILENVKTGCFKAGITFESKIIPRGGVGYDIVKFSKNVKQT